MNIDTFAVGNANVKEERAVGSRIRRDSEKLQLTDPSFLLQIRVFNAIYLPRYRRTLD